MTIDHADTERCPNKKNERRKKEKVGHNERIEREGNEKNCITNTFPLKMTMEVYNEQEGVYFVEDIVVKKEMEQLTYVKTNDKIVIHFVKQ